MMASTVSGASPLEGLLPADQETAREEEGEEAPEGGRRPGRSGKGRGRRCRMGDGVERKSGK